jgi:hypothetical protein
MSDDAGKSVWLRLSPDQLEQLVKLGHSVERIKQLTADEIAEIFPELRLQREASTRTEPTARPLKNNSPTQASKFASDFTKAHLLSKLADIARDEAFRLGAEKFRDGNLAETISGLLAAVRLRVERARPPLIDTGIRETLNDEQIDQLFEQAVDDAARERSEQAWRERQNCDEQKNVEGKEKRRTQADILIEIGLTAQLFHDGEDCYSTVTADDHWETYAIRSKGSRRWLRKLYFEQENASANREAMSVALDQLESFAHFKGKERKTFIRVARDGERLYLDLCNPNWQVIEIDSCGWRVIESKDCPVRFRRANGMRPLPLPQSGGSIEDLRDFINVASEEDFILVVGWLLANFREHGPYPILIEHGEQGCAKTTTARILRELADPSTAPVRSEPRDARDLMIAVNNGWLVCYDNLSHLEAGCRMRSAASARAAVFQRASCKPTKTRSYLTLSGRRC